MSHHEHKARAPKSARVAVITCSDTRTKENDTGGGAIVAGLQAGGHVVAGYEIVKDEPALILAAIERAAGAQAVLITGGTGITRRDSTFEAVSGVIARPLPGFGELFRMLSYGEIGSAAMLSRATAGVTGDGRLLFAMPGSPAGVKLAMEKLVLPELGHLLEELAR
ncbi:MAG TPA: MogA/MoaB family molybdenum cofactor biosynthesis protein [Myxococcales bacterium]|nr:MogA/MoaB family molybdenum cofactor biosynthesis protein [Myxococcales bacterium]